MAITWDIDVDVLRPHPEQPVVRVTATRRVTEPVEVTLDDGTVEKQETVVESRQFSRRQEMDMTVAPEDRLAEWRDYFRAEYTKEIAGEQAIMAAIGDQPERLSAMLEAQEA